MSSTVLLVDQEFLRQDVDDFLIRWYRHGPSGIDHAIDIVGLHLFVANRHDPVGIQAADVAAGDSGVDAVDLATRHEFCFFHGTLDRGDSRLDIHHHAFLQAA
jgi:hypothetical protein